MPNPHPDYDPVLWPFLNAPPAKQEKAKEAVLESHAKPVIVPIVRRRLCHTFSPDSSHLPWTLLSGRIGGERRLRTETRDHEDAQDAYGSARSKVALRLEKCHQDEDCRLAENSAPPASLEGAVSLPQPQRRGIKNFKGYVATTTSHCCAEVIRDRYPVRRQLSHEIEDILKPAYGFCTWQLRGGAERLCGLVSWQGYPEGDARHYRLLIGNPCAWFRSAFPQEDGPSLPTEDVVAAVFDGLGHPILLDVLVRSVMAIQQRQDVRIESTTPGEDADPAAPDPRLDPKDTTDIQNEAEQRAYLEYLWTEICELSLDQRRALLMGMSQLEHQLFTETHVAGLRQRAAALEMPEADLAGCMKDLPMPDLLIAFRFGITNVAARRQEARRRLARRMIASEWKKDS